MAADPYRARQRPGELPPRPPALNGARPRVLAHVHLYPPVHNAGAEWMLHTMLADLVARGWEAQVIATEYRGAPYVWHGVRVERAPTDREMGRSYAWADVAVTHLDATRHAMAWARRGRPLVHLVHNHRQLDHHQVRAAAAQLVVWNSAWIAEEYRRWPGRSMVVRPPVDAAAYATTNHRRFESGTCTLVNLAEAKGGPLFWRLARQRQDLRFVGVRGAYAGQCVPDKMPPNGVALDNGPGIVDVYRDTRVLLVPSSYESWGMAAVEALASGIPVVAHPTPGLLESLTLNDGTPAAIFADRDSDEAWLHALRQLDDLRAWRRWSDLARRRSTELRDQAFADLDAFADAMASLLPGAAKS